MNAGSFDRDQMVRIREVHEGEVYGVVIKVANGLVHVRMNRSGRIFRFPPEDLVAIEA
jgi:hypothetical protein